MNQHSKKILTWMNCLLFTASQSSKEKQETTQFFLQKRKKNLKQEIINEILQERVSSSRGKTNPRGFKRANRYYKKKKFQKNFVINDYVEISILCWLLSELYWSLTPNSGLQIKTCVGFWFHAARWYRNFLSYGRFRKKIFQKIAKLILLKE